MYKILIVEDDRVIADKMKEHLEKWDYEVACVQDFKRVQEEYTAFDPQLVIMDIILPFYNGFTSQHTMWGVLTDSNPDSARHPLSCPFASRYHSPLSDTDILRGGFSSRL